MDITSVEIFEDTENNKLEFNLFKDKIKVASFIGYTKPEYYSNKYIIFNAWDGNLSIYKEDNMLLFTHDEDERGCIKLYVNDTEHKFWNIIDNKIKEYLNL